MILPIRDIGRSSSNKSFLQTGFPPSLIKTTQKRKNEIEMRKIGDKSWILSPITGFQMQNPFRKPSDSNPQEPATTSNNSLTKVPLRWRENIKTGSIKRKNPNQTVRVFHNPRSKQEPNPYASQQKHQRRLAITDQNNRSRQWPSAFDPRSPRRCSTNGSRGGAGHCRCNGCHAR